MAVTPASPMIGLNYRYLIPLSVISAGLLLLGSNRRTWSTTSTMTRRHPTYWFDDGSVMVKITLDDGHAMLFRIHDFFLRRHAKLGLESKSEDGWDVPTIIIPPGIQAQDFTSLLAHLYHDTPLSPEAPFPHVAAILRVSSPEQLDIPSVHSLARSYLVSLFPSGPSPFVHPDHLEEALSLALRHNIPSIQKGIYYSIVTKTDFEPNPDAAQEATVSLNPTALTPTDIERCRQLMNGIVEHFAPVLFEPPVTPHMACTNVLADKWFPVVIQSAIAGDSVYKPLEALEQLKQIDWAAEGLCAACVREKREEWTSEQEDVWGKMDAWLKLSE